MKNLFKSLSLSQKVSPIFLFVFLLILFRNIDSNILLYSKLLDEGIDAVWMWKYLFQSGIMPLVYSLSLLFIFLGSKDKEGATVIELMQVLACLFHFFGILCFAFCFFYYDFNIYLAITKGLISSLYIMLLILGIIIIVTM